MGSVSNLFLCSGSNKAVKQILLAHHNHATKWAKRVLSGSEILRKLDQIVLLMFLSELDRTVLSIILAHDSQGLIGLFCL